MTKLKFFRSTHMRCVTQDVKSFRRHHPEISVKETHGKHQSFQFDFYQLSLMRSKSTLTSKNCNELLSHANVK